MSEVYELDYEKIRLLSSIGVDLDWMVFRIPVYIEVDLPWYAYIIPIPGIRDIIGYVLLTLNFYNAVDEALKRAEEELQRYGYTVLDKSYTVDWVELKWATINIFGSEVKLAVTGMRAQVTFNIVAQRTFGYGRLGSPGIVATIVLVGAAVAAILGALATLIYAISKLEEQRNNTRLVALKEELARKIMEAVDFCMKNPEAAFCSNLPEVIKAFKDVIGGLNIPTEQTGPNVWMYVGYAALAVGVGVGAYFVISALRKK